MSALKLRGRHLIAALALIAIAGIAIAIYLQGKRPTDAAGMTAYFPAREATTVYLDVAGMRDSGVLDKLVGSAVAEAQEYRTFVEATGFDYKRDLDRVMLNSAGGIHYFLLAGRFDWDKLRSYAEKNGGSCRAATCWLKGSTPDRIISFRPIQDDLMALSSARDEAGAQAIEFRRDGQPLYEVPPAPVWLHIPGEAIRAAESYPAGTRLFAKALESSERAIFTLGPAQDGFELAMNVTCRTAEDAAVLKAQLEGVTALLQKLISREKQTPNAGDLSGVLTAGAFERVDEQVRGRWPIRRAFIDSLGGS